MKKHYVWTKAGTGGHLLGFKTEPTPERVAELKTKHPEWLIIAANKPSLGTLMRWSEDGVARAMDGCKVEPDGTCEHGYPSWILAIGCI